MNFCPHCGSAVGALDTKCPKCGRVMAAEDKRGSAALNRSLKKTVIGLVGPAEAAEAVRAVRPVSKPTLLGIPAAPGLGPSESRADRADAGPADASNDATLRTADDVAADGNHARPKQTPPHMKTMVGLAGPDVSPATVAKAMAPPMTGLGGETSLARADAGAIAIVPAMPGRRAPEVGVVDTARSYQSASIAIGGGLVLATVAAAFAIFWRSPAPLRAEAHVDANGVDVLRMACATCPDGTVLRVGTTRATVAAESAELPLASPLKVGDNVFMVDVDRPGDGRDETVPLVVKIGYRIRPDSSQLDSEQPKLRVIVEGAPFANVTMGGDKLALGPEGSANYDVDVSTECVGLADEPKSIERSIPYSVEASHGGGEQGLVSLRVTVPPLRLDSPGTRAVVDADHVQLAGRTGRGARLTIGDQVIGVAADGAFSRSLPLPDVGINEVKLRAQLPGQATRTATLQLKRVENLADEAHEFAAKAHLSFATLMQDVGQHVGEPIAVAGEVVDARAQGGRTLALLDVKGCATAPCLARVVMAAGAEVARGETLNVYGYVTGTVGQGDASAAVAEIEAAFTTKNR
jgi:hypothetical protein